MLIRSDIFKIVIWCLWPWRLFETSHGLMPIHILKKKSNIRTRHYYAQISPTIGAETAGVGPVCSINFRMCEIHLHMQACITRIRFDSYFHSNNKTTSYMQLPKVINELNGWLWFIYYKDVPYFKIILFNRRTKVPKLIYYIN